MEQSKFIKLAKIRKIVFNITHPDAVDIIFLGFFTGNMIMFGLQKTLLKSKETLKESIKSKSPLVEVIHLEKLEQINDDNLQQDLDDLIQFENELKQELESINLSNNVDIITNTSNSKAKTVPLIRGGQNDVQIRMEVYEGPDDNIYDPRRDRSNLENLLNLLPEGDQPLVRTINIGNKFLSKIAALLYINYVKQRRWYRFLNTTHYFIYKSVGILLAAAGGLTGFQIVILFFPSVFAGGVVQYFSKTSPLIMEISFILYLVKNTLWDKPQLENLSKLLCETTKDYINNKYKLQLSTELKKVYDLGLQLNIIEEDNFPLTQSVAPFNNLILHEDLLFNMQEIREDVFNFLEILKVIKPSQEKIIELY